MRVGGGIRKLYDGSGKDRAPTYQFHAGGRGIDAGKVLSRLLGPIVCGAEVYELAVVGEHGRHLGAAEVYSATQYRVEHWLQLIR